MGGAVTEALVDYSRPVAGMAVLDLASGTGEPWPAIRKEATDAINRYRVGNEIRFGADIILAAGRA